MGATTTQLAKNLREAMNGPAWSGPNMTKVLEDVTFEEATASISGRNTIAVLVFHIGYYVRAVNKVMDGSPLDAHDKYSFDCPEMKSDADWQELKQGLIDDFMCMADHLESMEDNTLSEDFDTGKYGNHYRNLIGPLEHCYYHFGQISLIKEMLRYDKK